MADFRLLPILAVLGAHIVAAQQSGYPGIQEKLPVAVAPQPVPFSHRQHTAVGMKCVDCHVTVQRNERAGLPAADGCMRCHVEIRKDAPAIQRVARFAAEKRPIPWVRVYRLPDFVFFGHARHVNAGVQCQICHGSVSERDVLQKEVSTSMRMCVDCHRSRKASMDCSRCHELGQ